MDHPRELEAVEPDEPIDAEIIDAKPITPGEPEHTPDTHAAPPINPFAPAMATPDAGLMSLEDAVAAQREMLRRAVVRRALPRGRS